LLQWLRDTLLTLKDVSFALGPINFDLQPVIDPVLQMLQTTEKQFTPTLPSFATLIDSLQSAATVTVGVATNVAGTVFSGVFTAVVLIFSSIYISTDAHNFASRLVAISPPAYREEIAILLRRLAAIWRAYFRGQLNLMVIIGTVTWLGNTALGMPGAFALGVIAGVMEIIPSLGPFLAAIPAVIVALIQGSSALDVSNWVFALIIIGFYILVQQFENTFVVPRILGEAVDLHPLIVILGVVIGANVGGIIGALLAAPIIASGREIVQYLYMKILNEPPFPPEAEPPPRPSLRVHLRSALTKLRYYGARLSPPPPAPPTAEEDDMPPQ
jgi:predicted PurR-regulated permease PerM